MSDETARVVLGVFAALVVALSIFTAYAAWRLHKTLNEIDAARAQRWADRGARLVADDAEVRAVAKAIVEKRAGLMENLARAERREREG